ncbi:MAG: thioredoxin domain-containing protein [Alphaproteobacteria bacterium]|nr:thioredoxin domain-containing protein [Alphaproteobacteria bacterium]
MAGNLLGDESSPYLLQHADNPVEWYPWGKAAIDRAQELDRPILLSIGYAACHWCHVMAHESFEDPATAAVMNELFINIKVDREERPDIDTIYMTALTLFGERGGWPLTMFCTPEGRPFWGGTYFPPTSRYGQPGFPELLRHVARIYREEPDKVATNSEAVVAALEDMSQPQAAGMIAPEAVNRAAEAIVTEIDPRHGGIGTAPKFPQAPILNLLWRGYTRTGDTTLRDGVLLTLDKMAQGGIYDHLGGGFARYSTDAAWLAPHFEKMLYDNAQLLEIYIEAWQETQNPLYAQRIGETADWVLREMVNDTPPGGGFSATIDADSEGEEGKFYVWSEAEIRAVLGDDADLFVAAYDVRPDGNWEGKTILNRTRDPELKDDATEARLAACRQLLYEVRRGRIPPALDDKVLADWNGLMIGALARAATLFDRPDWLDAAQAAFQFVTTNMTQTDNGSVRLFHAWRNGAAKHIATLDDYANMCRGGLLLFEVTQLVEYIAIVQSWIDSANERYWDDTSDGYFLTADDANDVITRTKNSLDNATPAGNAIMAEVLARLYHLTGRDDYRDRCESLIDAFSGEAAKNPYSYVTLINAAQFLAEATQMIVIGDRENAGTRALLAARNRVSAPSSVVSVIASSDDLSPGHPAAGKTMIDGQPTAYVCHGTVCSAPLTDPQALQDLLAEK